VLRAVTTVVLGLFLTGCYFNLDAGSFGRVSPMDEVLVFGSGDGPKFAMIEVTGLISEASPTGALGTQRPSMVARFREALTLATEDDDIEGLLLRIRSPGGTVTASETLNHLIGRFKAETGRPVVAYLEGLATSGGYYTAVASDEIVAHPAAITGSIGVIMAGVNVAGLMERFGIADQTFTSGPFKDSGTPLREMRTDEREYLQDVVDDLHGQFRAAVVTGRPQLDADAVAAVADGRIYTADRALGLGLIDAVGHMEDAVEALEKRAEISDASVFMYHRTGEYRENLYSRGAATPVRVDVDVLSFDGPSLAPGFYYLWRPGFSSD
jgi:protease-4